MERRAHRFRHDAIKTLLVALLLFGPTGIVTADDGRCQEGVGKDFLLTSAVDAKLSPERLLKLNNALDAETFEIRSLLIVRDCKLVFERYKQGIGREHNHAIYSVTKSITATLVGALLHQGKLKSIDASISELVSKPSLREDDWKKAQRITLKTVMQMSSGLAYKHDPANHPIYALNADRFAMALSPELIAEPGSRFNYSDGDASLTGAVVSAVADRNLLRLAKDVLFDPLQMSNYDWWFMDRAGRYPGGWGLRLRPMDMAKVGQLYLQNGEWNGRRVFGLDFRRLAWTPGVNKSYGLHWWIGGARGAKGVPYFNASGFKGQRIYVFRALRLVVALTASLPGAEERKVTDLIVGAIVDAVDQRSATDETATLTALAAIQKKGFGGETRIYQREQDSPGRFEK